MADIFISYARTDRAAAQRLAEALEQAGWSVWWDRMIHGGQRFEEVIEEQLAQAGCVVVLWSRQSARSWWVRSEAGDGRERDILAPVLLEDTQIPLIFRGIHTVDLRGWEGDTDNPGFTDLVSAVSGRLNRSPPLPPAPPMRVIRTLRRGLRQASRNPGGPAGLLIGAIGAAIGIAVTFQYSYPTVSVDTGLGILFALTGLIVMFVMRALWRIVRGLLREP